MTSEFFHKIFNSSNINQRIDKLVIVTHLVPGSGQFLLAVNKKIPIAAVIPKPHSIDQRVVNEISPYIPILNYTRNQIKNCPEEFLKNLYQ